METQFQTHGVSLQSTASWGLVGEIARCHNRLGEHRKFLLTKEMHNFFPITVAVAGENFLPMETEVRSTYIITERTS
jgi:hypothetical protein